MLGNQAPQLMLVKQSLSLLSFKNLRLKRS